MLQDKLAWVRRYPLLQSTNQGYAGAEPLDDLLACILRHLKADTTPGEPGPPNVRVDNADNRRNDTWFQSPTRVIPKTWLSPAADLLSPIHFSITLSQAV